MIKFLNRKTSSKNWIYASLLLEQVPFIQSRTQQTELLTRAFKVTTTRELIIALGDFMNEKGIDFDKIEL